jgi:signal transduction histidine kinase
MLIGYLLRQRLSKSPLSFLVVIGVGFALGVVRTAAGWATYQVIETFAEIPFLTPLRPLASITATILVTIPVMILGSARHRFLQSRQKLLSLKVIQSSDTLAIPEEVLDFVDRTRAKISQLPKGPRFGEIRDLLRKIIATDLRPLSHKLWEIEDKRIKSFSMMSVFQNALNSHFFRPHIVVPIWFLTSAPVNITEFGLVIGIEMSLLRTALLLSVLVVASQIKTSSTPLQVTKLVLAVVGFILLQTLVGRGLLEPEDQAIQPRFVIASLVWITQLIVLVGMSWSLFESGFEVKSQLNRARGLPDAELSSTKGAEFFRSRKLARHLHGQVQNRLHALIDGIEPEEKAIDDDLLSKVDLILQSAIEPFEVVITSRKELEESLLAQWSGVIEISFEFLPSELLLTNDMWMMVSGVTEEGVANAVRHGFASSVKISIVLSDADLIVSIRDDGTGPRQGSPGIGTEFFSAISNDWVLKDTGSGSKLRLVLKTE